MALPMEQTKTYTLEELDHVWTLADKFVKSREKAGLTQEEMAAALTAAGRRTSKQTVSNWENHDEDKRTGNEPKRLFFTISLWAQITGFPEEWFRSRCFSPSAQVAEVPPMLGAMQLFDPDEDPAPFVPVLVGCDA